MEVWRGKVAAVTGANSGIGLAVAKELLHHGLTVVAIDKYIGRLKELCSEKTVNNNEQSRLYVRQTDIQNEEDVRQIFLWIDVELGGADVLLNIAGISGTTSLMDGSMKEWKDLLDVNVLGVCLCCQLAAKSMIKRDSQNAHIINLSSNVTWHTPREGFLHFYTATKHAVRSLTDGFRTELQSTNVKVSCISPGLVKTGIFNSSIGEAGDKKIFSSLPYLLPEDIAASVVYILSASPHVQIGEINIKHQNSLV